MGYWWVNQGRTVEDELGNGFLWCSILDRRGGAPWHWRTMTSVRKDDLVLHDALGHLHAISRVTHPAIEAPRPIDPPKDPKQQRGWLVRVRVRPLSSQIPRDDIPLTMRAGQAQRMFTRTGTVQQIYLSPVDPDWFAKFTHLFTGHLPAKF